MSTTFPAALDPQADPAERGRTTIADSVVEKIAAQASTEVEHVSAIRRRLRGGGSVTTHADKTVASRVATIRLEVGIDFPAPLRAVTRELRSHVLSEVDRQCGITLDHLDITVAALTRADQNRKRVR